MNKLDWFLVGCFIAGGLAFVSPFVGVVVFYDGDGYAAPYTWLAGVTVVSIIVGVSLWTIVLFAIMLFPNIYWKHNI